MKRKLRYKNFVGTCEFSPEDNVWFGKIENVKGLISYEGKDTSELELAFKEAVEDYIEMREDEGLLAAMLESDDKEFVSMEEVMKVLRRPN